MTAILFQFPSNGKVYSKDQEKCPGSSQSQVSIPFKRESVFKGEELPQLIEYLINQQEFQFPSNGKVYSKFLERKRGTKLESVSIPFKRESVFKVTRFSHHKEASWASFNSLQTGKCIQSESITKNSAKHGYAFQFPSNGKVYSKEIRAAAIRAAAMSFNSLQTGKCIQRDPILSPVGPWLQNAKTKRELREAFFFSKFTPKIPQTHVCIDPNTIFWQKRLGTQTLPVFLGNLRGVHAR